MNVFRMLLTHSMTACCIMGAFFAQGFVLSASAAPDEPSLVELWRKHEKFNSAPANHVEIAVQCDLYAKYFPDSQFLPVARGIAAWHELAAGRNKEAIAFLDKMISSSADPVAAAGNQMALRWLTRLDREQVVVALRNYFSDNVAYPENVHVLDKLPPSARPQLVDRWGRAWKYNLTGFKHLKRAKKQRYTLESSGMDPLTDLKESLKIPYASRINLKPVSIMAAVPGMATLLFETTDAKPEKAVVGENGMFQRRITFLKMTSSFVLLTDGDHWLLTARPSR